ncbi:MAG: SAM-dependent methyltransferase [Verrucomicrobia bacterium]|nr:SAM-dependent methyltransferase [Verrucomicrobiota bacterium]MDA1007211.1 SAM-dependent methyltransferase [Verrucomicrobiota bacterium]
MATHLRHRIEREGPLPFATFMAQALYHPDWGYYSAPDRIRVGRKGDFITSVSVGSTFGKLLAARLHSFWQTNGSPPAFHLLEPGPESGDLALDILSAAAALDPAFHQAIHYHAIEPLGAKARSLQARFANSSEPRLAVLPSAADLHFSFGAVLANEIIDALPVHLLQWHHDQWQERRVTCDAEAFLWTTAPLTFPGLRNALPTTPSPPPEGYFTEVCLEYTNFLAPLAAALEAGLLLLIDYGHTEADYYAPTRTTGTLQTFHQHKATDHPLHEPGSRDFTAHANFTRLAATGRALGLTPTGFTRQERYLTALAEPLLANLDPSSDEFAATIRQFRTLTHPAMLGSSFHMLEFIKAPVTPCNKPFQFEPRGLELL